MRSKGLIVVALPVVPLACFWLIVAITYFQREVPTNTRTRSLVVQTNLARVFAALLDADAGVRDHLLTENRAALERYRTAIGRLPPAFAELNNALIDSRLRQTLDTLQSIVDDELNIMTRLTGGYAPAAPRLGERASLDRSVWNLNRIREVSLAIEQRQSALTEARDVISKRSSQRSFFLFLFGSILCVGAGFIAAVLTSAGVSRRVALLAKNADRLAKGESIKAAPMGKDEIAHLDGRFREAAFLLRQRERELRQATEDQRRLNAALEVRTTELELANRELEAFSYSVSHDLRAPLRAIDGFSRTLAEEHEQRLDEVGRDALCRVRSSARRMGELIDGLLDLSHVTRMALHRERLDLGSTAETILSELAAGSPARSVDVRIERDLMVDADPHMVRIALQNLLDNAWKYTGKTSSARIEIGSTPNGDARVFHIRDNGAGFDMRHATKLFGAFQRLHARHDFDGTGVGLATVQRIVHRHGGKIWAEAAIDSGATFFFTLEPEESPSCTSDGCFDS